MEESVPESCAGRFESSFVVEVDKPALLVLGEELLLARKTLAKNPASATLKLKVASLLNESDAFDEAIEMLTELAAGTAPDPGVLNALAFAHLARGTVDDTRTAAIMAHRLLDASTSGTERAGALAMLAKALMRLGEDKAARDALLAAIAAAPAHADAFYRLAKLEARTKGDDAVMELTDEMIERGVCSTVVLIHRTIALAKLGHTSDARNLAGFEGFLHQSPLPTPKDWPSLDELNSHLARELTRHPSLRLDHYGKASVHSWRVETPATRSKYVPKLQEAICRAVETFISALPLTPHPWRKAQPSKAKLKSWSIITGGEGHENWHYHQSGWLSGVYYVDVPSSIANGEGKGGCIAFGLPEDKVGDEIARAFGEILIRPYSGLLLLFPSHACHRTFPHGGDEKRICFAFDVVPA